MHEVKLKTSAVTNLLSICLLACYIGAPAHADPGDLTLYCLPHVTGTPGDSHVVSLEINTAHDIGGFFAVFTSEAGLLSADGISYDGTRSEGVPVFTGGVGDQAYLNMRAVVIYQPPGYVPAGFGPVINIILTSDPSIPKGTLLPLIFRDDTQPAPLGYVNEMSDPTGIDVYFPDFNHGSILFGLDTILSSPGLGDVDLNGVPFEPGDLQLMHTQLQGGIGYYVDEEQQTLASDANFDQLPWTIADLLTVKAVCEGYEPVPTGDTVLSLVHWAMDSIWFDGFTGSPTDTVQIPIYFANGMRADGISFKLDYSTDELQYISHSMVGSRLPPSWDLVSVTNTETGLMFYAMPDESGNPYWFPLLPGDGLLVTLEFEVLDPVSTLLTLQFERLQTLGQANGYATYEDGLWMFASFQQVDANIRMSFVYGDTDSSGAIDIDDVVYLISHLFDGGPEPEPSDAGDFDRNLVLNVDDAIALIDFIFGQ
jgi:hypothetical protein